MATTPTYLVISTRDPFTTGPPGEPDPLVEGLARQAPTTVVLAQNAVLAARRASSAAASTSRLAATARVMADDFALRERGINPEELAEGIAVTTMDQVVDLVLADGCRTIWR